MLPETYLTTSRVEVIVTLLIITSLYVHVDLKFK